MRAIKIILFMMVIFIGCKGENATKHEHSNNENVEEKVDSTKKKVLSPHTSTMAMIGEAHIHIDYSSPGVRGRIIFGGLLAFDEVWQAGAHMATWIETNIELSIEGNTLPAGKYGFFIIPSQADWTLIFNSNWDQHGKDEYDEKEDLFRFKIKPDISETSTEHLSYNINKIDESHGTISFAWEKVSLKFNFEIKN